MGPIGPSEEDLRWLFWAVIKIIVVFVAVAFALGAWIF